MPVLLPWTQALGRGPSMRCDVQGCFAASEETQSGSDEKPSIKKPSAGLSELLLGNVWF